MINVTSRVHYSAASKNSKASAQLVARDGGDSAENNKPSLLRDYWYAVTGDDPWRGAADAMEVRRRGLVGNGYL